MGSLREDLATVINTHSVENGSNTPDFILGEYLEHCIKVFDLAIMQREAWYGRNPAKGPELKP